MYLYGKVRRSDWIPVHSPCDSDAYQLRRSDQSDDDYSSDEEAAEYFDEDDQPINLRQYSLKGKPFRDPHRLEDEDGECSDGTGSDSSDSISTDDSDAMDRTRLAIRKSRAGFFEKPFK